jgi:hypothetical protein
MRCAMAVFAKKTAMAHDYISLTSTVRDFGDCYES